VTSERWRRIEDLYHRASAIPAAERAAFLRRVCSDDDSVVNEVEELLGQPIEQPSALDDSAAETLARAVAAGSTAAEGALVGAILSHYRILEPIGRGGMGIVYKAEDVRLGRTVALKFLPDHLTQDPGALERFEREARAASALNHPNICTVYEIDEDAGRRFIAIEYLEGQTLRQRIAQGPLSFAELAGIASDVCAALEAAHANGIVHRDIKPANVFITRPKATKVLDFGAAHRLGLPEPPMPAGASSDRTETRLTETGAALGTAAYMSPEHAQGEAGDARTDVFSLGVVLFEMATGQLPVSAAHPAEQAPQPGAVTRLLRQLRPEAPARLVRLIARALAPDRSERYATVSELRADLQQLQRVLANAKRRRRLVSVALGLAAVLAIFIALAVRNPKIRGWIAGRPGFTAVYAARAAAVLPFQASPGDSMAALYAAGVTNALTTELQKLGNVQLASAEASARYKGSPKNLQAIARELQVESLVRGVVQISADRVRVSAELIDAMHGQRLWEGTYERSVHDILRLQSDLAVAIARELSGEFTWGGQTRRSRPAAVNPQAYEEYLKGIYFHENGQDAKAAEHYEKAIASDPSFAAASTGLAESYAGQAYDNSIRPAEAYEKAEALLAKSLQLDPDSSLAHTLAGMIKLLYRCDRIGAERDLSRAVALSPGDMDALSYHSYYLLEIGRTDEAIAEKRRILKSDPASSQARAELGLYQIRAGHNQEAIGELQEALELDPQNVFALLHLGTAYINLGQYAQAVAALRRAALLGNSPQVSSTLAYAYARMGQRQEALAIVRQLQQQASEHYVSPAAIARVYSGLGDHEQALEWLRTARRGDRPSPADPAFDELRTDKRFATLAASLNPRADCPPW